MTSKKTDSISELHPELTWAQRAILDYIHRHNPTKSELLAASPDPTYGTQNRYRELRKLGLVTHKQDIKPAGGRQGRFGESRYYVTDQALNPVPRGTQE